MKYILVSLVIFANGFSSFSQSFDIDTILNNGNIDDYLNIVILGDGYQASELDKFSTDAINIKNALFKEEPYANYQNYFNVFAIRVPSNESGASHPGTATDVSEPAHPIKTVDNYFGSSFDAFNIHRLLVASNGTAVFNVLADNFPLYDQVVILVNSPHYGGSGGTFATTSLNSSANEIAIHEIGHSFSNLIDEYYAGDVYAREGTNMTAETDPSKVRWKNWLDYKEVGIYAHGFSGNSAKWFRPHENCKMRFLGAPFCPVCVEGTIETIHSLVPSIKSVFPEWSSLVSSDLPLTFRAQITKPSPNSLGVKWSLNGEIKSDGVDTMDLVLGELLEGINEIILTVEDQSGLLRVEGHHEIHMELVLWEIDNSVSGIKEVSIYRDKLNIDLYPNPTQDYISLRCSGDIGKLITVDLYDTQGNFYYSKKIFREEQHFFDVKNLSPGTYFVRFQIGKHILGVRKIVKL